MYHDYFHSPIGVIKVTATDQYISSVLFVEEAKETARDKLTPRPNALTEECTLELKEYFARERKVFELPIFQDGTDFQQAVRERLQNIPYGKTVYYKHIAEELAREDAVRAVAAAIGKNKIDIIIPCHRVLGSTGALTGYNGGIERKRFLLALEQDDIFSS